LEAGVDRDDPVGRFKRVAVLQFFRQKVLVKFPLTVSLDVRGVGGGKVSREKRQSGIKVQEQS
jgi:hypothetical protein